VTLVGKYPIIELTYEEQRAAASFGYGTPRGTKAQKQPDTAAWDEEIKRRAEEIEAARPQHTPEQAQAAKDVTKRTLGGYPRPDAQP